VTDDYIDISEYAAPIRIEAIESSDAIVPGEYIQGLRSVEISIKVQRVPPPFMVIRLGCPKLHEVELSSRMENAGVVGTCPCGWRVRVTDIDLAGPSITLRAEAPPFNATTTDPSGNTPTP
jgi:hypothetical protein